MRASGAMGLRSARAPRIGAAMHSVKTHAAAMTAPVVYWPSSVRESITNMIGAAAAGNRVMSRTMDHDQIP